MDALRRSKLLGKGLYWRNFGIVFLLGIFAQLILGVIEFGAGLMIDSAGRAMGLSIDTVKAGASTIGGLIGGLSSPLTFVATILLYYDMRARKEGYDLSALAEDLRR